jgi:hypothetical protein
MSENLDHRLDERLRTALHDLDRRIDQHLAPRTAASPEPGTEPGAELGTDLRSQVGPRVPTRRRGPRLVPALAGFAVIALLVTIGWLARPSDSTPPAVNPPTPTVTTPPPTTESAGSQSFPDAARDGVNLFMAWLSVSQRVAPSEPFTRVGTTRITAPEGTWVISEPDLEPYRNPATSCVVRKGKGEGKTRNAYDICYGYSEILLMSTDLKRILRAYPIPDLPAQWLVLTPDAIYCGRQGDGAIPDSMVCRIDRSTHAFTGRVFPHSGLADPPVPHTFAGWPGTWSNNPPTSRTGFDRATIDPTGALRISNAQGKSTITLDPITLKPSN